MIGEKKKSRIANSKEKMQGKINGINQRNNSGITLIALVVTIVVLIILAVITVNIVFNENGILRKAEQSKDFQANAEASDQAALDTFDQHIANVMAESEMPTAIPGKKVTGSNAIYTDSNEETAIIPVGFAVVTDPDTISNGLVISDVENDDMANTAKGNQFVWIPVTDYSKFHLIEGYWNGSIDTMLSDGSKEAGDTEEAGSPLEANNTAGTAESIAMYKSVKDNGGFYIARFEAGIANTDESGNPVDNYSLETKVVANGTVKPLSQKGVGVWNTIPWGGTSSDTASDGMQGDDTADGAVKVARSMYTKSSTCGVTSTLCYGVQWDAVMNFIDQNYYKADGTLTSFVADSTDKGNYTGSLLATGYYEEKHIYDLAGNVYEWTMEAYVSDNRVLRGGNYDVSGADYPASIRDDNVPDTTDVVPRASRSFIFVALFPSLEELEIGESMGREQKI